MLRTINTSTHLEFFLLLENDVFTNCRSDDDEAQHDEERKLYGEYEKENIIQVRRIWEVL